MIKIINEDIWNNTLIEVHNYFIMREKRKDPLSKKLIEKIIRNDLYSLVEYWFKNKNFKKRNMADFYDAYHDMVDRALRNFNPVEKSDATFKTYFSSGLENKYREQENEQSEKSKREKHIDYDKEYEDDRSYNTVKPDELPPLPSAEDEVISKEKYEEKENLKKVFETILKIREDMISIREALDKKDLTAKTESGYRYKLTFFTADNIGVLRVGASVSIDENKNKNMTYITPEEVLDIMNKDSEGYYKTFDTGLLEYIFVRLPKDVEGIAKDELKKHKDILGDKCMNPDTYIKVPLVAKDTIRAYLHDVHGLDVTPQSISKGKNSYKKLMGKYSLPWD